MGMESQVDPSLAFIEEKVFQCPVLGAFNPQRLHGKVDSPIAMANPVHPSHTASFKNIFYFID